MTTEPTVSDIPAIVDAEASKRVEGVAAVAAAQVDDANKTAEALARAAEASHLGTRIQSIEEGNATWRAEMEARMTAEAAARAEQSAELKASILAAISPPPIPAPIVEAPVVESGSVAPAPSSKPMDTTAETTPKRRRLVL